MRPQSREESEKSPGDQIGDSRDRLSIVSSKTPRAKLEKRRAALIRDGYERILHNLGSGARPTRDCLREKRARWKSLSVTLWGN